MREPYVSKPNYPLLLAVIAAHALALTYALRPGLFGVVRDRIAPAGAHAAMQGKGSPPAQRPAPTRAAAMPAETPADDPRREFDVEAWIANNERVAREQAQTTYGDLAAALSAEPARALDTLRRRYADGDDRADKVRFAVAWECANGHTFYDDPQSAPPIERQLDGVAPADAALLRGVYDAGRKRWQSIRPRCDAWDAQNEAWRAVTLKYREGRGPNAQFERLQQTYDRDALTSQPSLLDALLKAIDKLWAREPDDELARRLAEYMLTLDDEAARARGLALLVALAERDARYAGAVADAYRALDGRAPYDAGKAETWAQRAAQAGAPQWLRDRADRAGAANDPAGAWAWHAYALWLSANGCGAAHGTYGEAELARGLRGVAAANAALAPDARRPARERYRELVAQHGKAALAALRCEPGRPSTRSP